MITVFISFFSDLSKNTALKDIILESFNHSNEEVKSAASYALGNISLGNMQAYLPFVLHEIETKPKRQYLLLHSLKEVIQISRAHSDSISQIRSSNIKYFKYSTYLAGKKKVGPFKVSVKSSHNGTSPTSPFLSDYGGPYRERPNDPKSKGEGPFCPFERRRKMKGERGGGMEWLSTSLVFLSDSSLNLFCRVFNKSMERLCIFI